VLSHARDAATPAEHAGDSVDVVLIRWPSEEAARRQLAQAGMPRVLLIDDGSEPPPDWDRLEDWVRLPVTPADLAARQATVRERWHEQRAPGMG
jgi:hypothetical protein